MLLKQAYLCPNQRRIFGHTPFAFIYLLRSHLRACQVLLACFFRRAIWTLVALSSTSLTFYLVPTPHSHTLSYLTTNHKALGRSHNPILLPISVFRQFSCKPNYQYSAFSRFCKSLKMVESHLILHVIEILGVFFCAHHLWPKGVTYGEQEEWEKAHRKRQSRQARRKGHSNSSSPIYEDSDSPDRGMPRRRESRRERGEYIEYESRSGGGSRHGGGRSMNEIEYGERSRSGRKSSSRY